MTSREIAIINWIACEGLDNSEWGVCTNDGQRVADQFDVEIGGQDCCPDKFIYVWTDEDTAKCMVSHLQNLGVSPDGKYTCTDEKTMVLVFDIS